MAQLESIEHEVINSLRILTFQTYKHITKLTQ